MLAFTVFFSFGITSAYADGAEKIESTNQVKHLHRSQTDKVFGGVCGGIAEYFNIDPTLVRVGFVVWGLVGVGDIVYIVLWIAIPNN